MPSLVLGPMLRYVDDRTATVWVQTDLACEVEILGARARTWCVDGLHFALVAVQGSPDDGDVPYHVRLDGTIVWPQEPAALPPSTIRFTDARRPLDVVFGSCRITRPHVPPYVLRASEHPDGQGVDALRAYALRLADRGGAAACPDMLLMLGDQIYADEPSPALREQIATRDRLPGAPEDELADIREYAMAYREAWSEPAIRWLFSTVPVTMVFDDHEIHAEWRISQGWLDEMNAEPWFDHHIRSGLAAYWVFQHLGNLSPAELEHSELFREVREADDAAELLAAHMDTEGRQSGHSRWSFARDVGDSRLIVIDSRAGRDVTPGRRRLIRDEEWEWIREQARHPARHLLLASSVPFLLAPGLHHVEAFDEALTERAWGRLGAVAGERLRRLAVMDHWASFGHTFRRLAALLDDVARGREGAAPSSVVMLSGDVHHCYVAEVGHRGPAERRSPVWQVVCSAFRKELAPHELRILAFGHSKLGERVARRLARAAGVPPLPIDWRVVERPAFANQIGTLTLDGDRCSVRIEAVADEGDRLETAFERALARAPLSP